MVNKLKFDLEEQAENIVQIAHKENKQQIQRLKKRKAAGEDELQNEV